MNEAEQLMLDAANRLRNLMLKRDPTLVDEDNTVPVAVSVD